MSDLQLNIDVHVHTVKVNCTKPPVFLFSVCVCWFSQTHKRVCVCDCARTHACIISNYSLCDTDDFMESVKQNLISATLLTSDNFKLEGRLFVKEGLMIIWTPQDFTGEAQKATEVKTFTLLAWFGWNCMPCLSCSLWFSRTNFSVNNVADTLQQQHKDFLTDWDQKYILKLDVNTLCILGVSRYTDIDYNYDIKKRNIDILLIIHIW